MTAGKQRIVEEALRQLAMLKEELKEAKLQGAILKERVSELEGQLAAEVQRTKLVQRNLNLASSKVEQAYVDSLLFDRDFVAEKALAAHWKREALRETARSVGRGRYRAKHDEAYAFVRDMIKARPTNDSWDAFRKRVLETADESDAVQESMRRVLYEFEAGEAEANQVK